jgi:hypothetical protein
MKKWLLGIGVLVLMAAGGLAGVGVYQNYVVGKIKEVLLQSTADWQGAAGGVKYSFWDDEITLIDFSFSFNTTAGAYSAAIGQAVVRGIHTGALQSSDDEVLVDKIILDDFNITHPGGASYHSRREVIGKIKGPFGQLQRQICDGASQGVMQALGRASIADVLCEDVTIQGLPYHFDALTIAQCTADNYTLLSAKNINMSDIKLIRSGQTQGSVESLAVSYDLLSLASVYTLGEEEALFRRVLAFRDPFKLDIELKDVDIVLESADGGEIVPVAIGSYKCNIISQDRQLVADMQLGAMTFPLLRTGRDIRLSFDLSSRLARDNFYPTRLKLVIDDMARFDSEILFRGVTLSEARLQKLFLRYADDGALNYFLQQRSANRNETAAQAGSGLIADISKEFADRNLLKNNFLSDLLSSLEQFVNNPGVLEINIAPSNPMSVQQAALAFLIQPRVLNYAITIREE